MIITTMLIAVIICAYTEERWDDLVAAVASLRRQTLLPSEIIIVIDHNKQLFERARAQFADATVVENKAARGLSGARNTGLEIARGDLIAFLDDDAEAAPDWLERLCDCSTDPKVLGVGGTVVPRWLGKRPNWFPSEFYWVVGCTYQHIPDQPIVVRNPYGGCTCIKQEVFQTIGGFREGIGRIGTVPMGGEETELSIRATQHWPEKVFLYEPRALIYHRIPAQRARWHYFLSRCYAEGISKATITKFVGAKDSLSSERAYTTQMLPRGVCKGITDALLRRDPSGFLRAGAIIAGLVTTTAGYVKGSLKRQPLPTASPAANQDKPSLGVGKGNVSR
ncbi:glycosyltransferase family 2 protein [Reticulibacter mediterranei]|nr:glycosyltransferase family 2 protein [Reticulibacter mediterranei]